MKEKFASSTSTDYDNGQHVALDDRNASEEVAIMHDPPLWNVYLSGEIHTQWREQIAAGIERARLPVRLSAPVTDHAASDDCAVKILGEQADPFWKDRKGAGINAIRTRTLIRNADVVVVRFGSKYRQWNAAFDAGIAAAMGKPLVTLHDSELDHALKEIDAAACATARTAEQVVEILRYVIEQA